MIHIGEIITGEKFGLVWKGEVISINRAGTIRLFEECLEDEYLILVDPEIYAYDRIFIKDSELI